MTPALIFCADGNPRFASIAVEQGFLYGAQLPNTVYTKTCFFVDQDWKSPNREKYMAALREHRPALATVLDLEREAQLDEVLSWADEAAAYVTEAVIIIPKVMGIIPRLPSTIRGKQVRLGYSVPTSFAGTELPTWEFGRRPVHLLGGSPNKQLELTHYLNVQSADGNYSTLMATKYGQFYACNGMARVKDRYWPRLSEVHRIDTDIPYHAFRLSCINILAAWNGCRGYIRYGAETDITAIKRVANQYKNELGFVNSAALKESARRYMLYVAEYKGEVVGFVNFYRRKDGWQTVYEIAVDRRYHRLGIGRALLNAVPKPVRLKCTVDNRRANDFYGQQGMVLRRVEQGRKRLLNVWEHPVQIEEVRILKAA